jgi:glycerophosphoryl diester phosphodiesterase
MLFLLVPLLTATADAAPKACAHRGDTKAAPENTIAAFESAVRKGAHMIEFDVQLSKDGELVIMHDPTVDRTTSGTGKVADLTFEELRALDAGTWFSADFAGTKIPTLRETLEAIPASILCNVHLKPGGDAAAKSAKLIEEMGRIEQCYLACSTEQIAEARGVVPNIKTCNMTRQLGNPVGYAEDTAKLNAEMLQFYKVPPDKLPEAMKVVEAEGLIANYCCAEEEAVIRQLCAAGVEYILTDDLDLCLRIVAEHR